MVISPRLANREGNFFFLTSFGKLNLIEESKISHVNQMTRYADILFHKGILQGYTYDYYILNGRRKGFYIPLCQVLLFSSALIKIKEPSLSIGRACYIAFIKCKEV